MAVNLAQYKGYSNNSGTPGSPRDAVFDSSVTAGSLIVAVISRYCDFAVRQAGVVTDDNGNSYSQIESPGGWYSAGNTDFQVWYALNANAGSTTVTSTWTGTGSGYEQIIAAEFTGVKTSGALLDSEVLDTEGSASTTPATGTVTPGAAGNLLVAGFQTSAWSVDPGVSGSWTKIVDMDNGIALAWQEAPSTSDVSGTWSLSSAYAYLGCTLAFDHISVTLAEMLPDADIVTTGWSTAPLYSKINDASDGTVITATAS